MKLEIRILKPLRNRKIFITGFQGIGLVGFLSVKHLISALNCERVGFIQIPQEPPYSAYVFDYNKLNTPCEIYHDEKTGITLFLAHWGFLEKYMYVLMRTIAQWVCLNRYEIAILFGGLDSEVRGNDPHNLRVVVTSAFKKCNYSICEAKEMEMNYLVIGPLALLLNEFERLNFPAIAVLPYANKWRADPAAAITGLEYFSRCFNIPVDLEKLKEFAIMYEKEVEKIRKAIEEERKREFTPYYI